MDATSDKEEEYPVKPKISPEPSIFLSQTPNQAVIKTETEESSYTKNDTTHLIQEDDDKRNRVDELTGSKTDYKN